MFVVLFSEEGAVLGAVRKALWPSSDAATRAPNLGGHADRSRLFAELGLRAEGELTGAWRVVGPSSDASADAPRPTARAALFAHCEASLGEAPWLLRDWYGEHGWGLLSLLTRDEELATRVARAAQSACVR